MVADARCWTCGGVKIPNGTTKGEPSCKCAPDPQMAHRFGFGQKVIADKDDSNPMIVTGVIYRPNAAVEFECAYWCNGDEKSAWVPGWRLSPKPEF